MVLLDANVLIALGDANHPTREAAKKWFLANRAKGWATCALTENAFLRIVGNSSYPKGPGSPAEAAKLLAALMTMPGHRFLTSEVSLLDSKHFESLDGVTPSELTDVYLLGLAASHGARFATFDRRIRPDKVKGGTKALWLLPV